MKELLDAAALTIVQLALKTYLAVTRYWHPGAGNGGGLGTALCAVSQMEMHKHTRSVPTGVGRLPSLVILDLLEIWNAPRVRFPVVLQPGSSFNIASP